MASKPKVYWDSCAWLGLLNEESNKISELQYVWKRAVAGEVEIWTSTIAQVEVCKLASEQTEVANQGKENKVDIMTEDNLKLIENVFNQPFVKRIPVDVEISTRARRLYRETKGLDKVPDAVHLVSAMRWNIETVHTFDEKDMLHLSGKLKTDLDTEITIMSPTETEPDDLFTALDEPESN